VTREQRITVKGPVDFIQRKTRDSNSRIKESFIVKALERFELGSQDIKTTNSCKYKAKISNVCKFS